MKINLTLSDLVAALEIEVAKNFNVDPKTEDKIVAIIVSDILENGLIKWPL